jgi:hypothetical protein
MTTHYPSASLSRLPGPIPKARISSAYRERKPAGVLKSNQTFISAAHLEFAQALSQNGIAWLYKPRTFAIEWDRQGGLVDSITPDFYLPDYRQFLAVAAVDEDRVACNATRLRLLRRVHPELDCRLVIVSNSSHAIERFLATGNWTG